MIGSYFSGNESKTFINVSRDNRIHLFDTDSRKEKRSYVEKHNLQHSYECSALRCGKKDTLGFFAVGASDGTIIIWDLTRGVVAKVLGQSNESPIPTSIAFTNDSKYILVSSSQNIILKYDVITGEIVQSIKAGKKGVSRIATNPKVDVIAAGG